MPQIGDEIIRNDVTFVYKGYGVWEKKDSSGEGSISSENAAALTGGDVTDLHKHSYNELEDKPEQFGLTQQQIEGLI